MYFLVKHPEYLEKTFEILSKHNIPVEYTCAVRIPNDLACFIYRGMMGTKYFRKATMSITDKTCIAIVLKNDDLTIDIDYLKKNVQGSYNTNDTNTIRGYLKENGSTKYCDGSYVHVPDSFDMAYDDLKGIEQLYR